MIASSQIALLKERSPESHGHCSATGRKNRKLEVTRVWLLRAFVVLFLDFVMF